VGRDQETDVSCYFCAIRINFWAILEGGGFIAGDVALVRDDRSVCHLDDEGAGVTNLLYVIALPIKDVRFSRYRENQDQQCNDVKNNTFNGENNFPVDWISIPVLFVIRYGLLTLVLENPIAIMARLTRKRQMADNAVIIGVAKVLVAAAWADGQISNAEINSLKDLTFHLPGMTAADWAQIDIYIDSPVGKAERARLVAELEEMLKTQADKDLALQALDHLLQSAPPGATEQEIIEQIKTDIQNAKVTSWGRFIRGRTDTRSQAMQSAPNRELLMDDFVNNKIFYDVKRMLTSEDDAPQVSDEDLRRLSLAGGLLARVAYADMQVSSDENQAIIAALQEHWALSPLEAAVVAKAAEANIQADLDYYRLTRAFFEATTEEERVRFLDVLFAVITSDGRATFDEIEEIRHLAGGLLLTHQQFIEAKLKVPKALREE
jgi:uncharacterized tellurite resistance protein B-like protein